jgi:hypothetical protein
MYLAVYSTWVTVGRRCRCVRVFDIFSDVDYLGRMYELWCILSACIVLYQFHADAAAGAIYVGEQAKTEINVAQALSLQC